MTITEHDAVFNDEGTSQQTIELNLENGETRAYIIVIPVTERRWFFWKATARFSVVIETLVLSIPPEMRVPTVDDPKWTEDFNDDDETILLARVILKPKQYSSFNANDANRYLVENPLANENDVDNRAWRNCYTIAADILSNRISDPTNGANHFFDDSISPPSWAKQEYFKVKIDSFLFYDIL